MDRSNEKSALTIWSMTQQAAFSSPMNYMSMDTQKYCENQYIMLVHLNSNNSYQFLTVTVSNDLLATKNHKHVVTSPI